MVCYGLLCGMFFGHLYAKIVLEDAIEIETFFLSDLSAHTLLHHPESSLEDLRVLCACLSANSQGTILLVMLV